MRKTSVRFELHSAAKMRIEDFFVDAQSEVGEDIPTNVRADIDDVINGTHKTFRYMLVTGLLAAVSCLHGGLQRQGALAHQAGLRLQRLQVLPPENLRPAFNRHPQAALGGSHE